MITHSTTVASNGFSEIEKKLLNDYQQDFPLTSTPFADIAAQLGTDEQTVLECLRQMKSAEIVSRVGAVFRANRVGVSTLAAIAVPKEKLEAVAGMVSSFDEVNHNYEREHLFNLWFVLNAVTHDELQKVVEKIEQKTGLPVMQLPMLNDFHIDLGFTLQWT